MQKALLNQERKCCVFCGKKLEKENRGRKVVVGKKGLHPKEDNEGLVSNEEGERWKINGQSSTCTRPQKENSGQGPMLFRADTLYCVVAAALLAACILPWFMNGDSTWGLAYTYLH